MTTLREAAQQALEALDWLKERGAYGDFDGVVDALRAALAEPVQEPVAWMMVNETHKSCQPRLVWEPQTDWHITWKAVPLYTTPPQRKPLTEEEIGNLWYDLDGYASPMFRARLDRFARAIERAHGIGGKDEQV